MGRPPLYGADSRIRIHPDLLARVDAALEEHETRSDLFRTAIEREVVRRERERSRKAKAGD
jgi:metal-responsive CopG/Arc/MetJ family transcriptional regulator